MAKSLPLWREFLRLVHEVLSRHGEYGTEGADPEGSARNKSFKDDLVGTDQRLVRLRRRLDGPGSNRDAERAEQAHGGQVEGHVVAGDKVEAGHRPVEE